MHIPFNKPYVSGNEAIHIASVISKGHLSGNGEYTQKCQKYFEDRYGFGKVLLTNSCTAALEMSAILADIKSGDEVIVPSYTYVSTANAFALRGANIVFADSLPNNPNIDPDKIENLITDKTKALVIVHYAGFACNMDKIVAIAKKHNLILIEDAAHAIESKYKDKYLGTYGDMATFSFHETKNIITGEGGMLAINNEKLYERAEIIWEKGTNRASFNRGEVPCYQWIDIGSSFLPSDLTAAFLFGQLEIIDRIQQKRIKLFDYYYDNLIKIANKYSFKLPDIPEFSTKNGHIFYIVLPSNEVRTKLADYLKSKNIHALFHYLSLHQSPYYKAVNPNAEELKNSQMFTSCLLRLPMYYSLTYDEIDYVVENIHAFFSDINK